jgi:hypothetical protein
MGHLLSIIIYISILIAGTRQGKVLATEFDVVSLIPVASPTSNITEAPLEPTIENDGDDLHPTDDSVPVVDSEPIPCKPGESTGYGISRMPNSTSKVVVGTPFNVSWDYTVGVTTPPTFMDVYVQLIASGVRERWNNQIARVPAEPRWFIWTPIGFVNGRYKLRYVPDGKETFNIAADKLPCFENGESVPFVSATFSISNSRGDLGNYRDPFAPNSARKMGSGKNLWVFSIVFGMFVVIGFA